MLELTRSGRSCCDQVYSWSEKRLAALDDQILFLQNLRSRLMEFRRDWKEKRHGVAVSDAEICALIENFDVNDDSPIGKRTTTLRKRA